MAYQMLPRRAEGMPFHHNTRVRESRILLLERKIGHVTPHPNLAEYSFAKLLKCLNTIYHVPPSLVISSAVVSILLLNYFVGDTPASSACCTIF